MKHRFLPELPLYIQCVGCGYVDESPDIPSSHCQGCGEVLSVSEIWFPDAAYEYAILIEDYDTRPPTDFRKKYFEAVAEENHMEYFCSMTEPEFKPTDDWKPITVLLFRSLFEILLEHFLWKTAWTYCLPSPDAERLASHILDSSWTVSSRISKVYSGVTGHKWKDDIEHLGRQNIGDLLKITADIRNDFIHGNPLAGHQEISLPNRARKAVPELFALFAELANLHIHPRALILRGLKIEQSLPHRPA
jgi:hypothetical protein